MKINSSLIGMESARTYEVSTTRKLSYYVKKNSAVSTAVTEEELGAEEELKNPKDGGEESLGDIQARMNGTGKLFYVSQNTARDEFAKAVEEIRQQSIIYLWRLLFGEKSGRDIAERLGLNGEETQKSMGGLGSSYINGLYTDKVSSVRTGEAASIQAAEGQSLQLVAKEEVFYTEKESTNFSTTGKVFTADGREISFNLSMGMSKSVSRYISQEKAVMCDPLVINLSGNIAEVSDQKFYFDLDADGEKEAISRLCEDSGYLALDLNGDGVINDGSELFGTKSGDGFKDLAKYDEDGNGWIDENDAIWEKLQIWIQQEDGSSRLYRLEEKGIGALCLQNISTDYTQIGSTGEVNAAIRSTGIFLYENGLAGTLQHLDLAVQHLEQMA